MCLSLLTTRARLTIIETLSLAAGALLDLIACHDQTEQIALSNDANDAFILHNWHTADAMIREPLGTRRLRPPSASAPLRHRRRAAQIHERHEAEQRPIQYPFIYVDAYWSVGLLVLNLPVLR